MAAGMEFLQQIFEQMDRDSGACNFEFTTSLSYGFGAISLAVGSGGYIFRKRGLHNEDGSDFISVIYVVAGGSVGAPVSGTFSTADMYSGGKIFMGPGVSRLSPKDFQGPGIMVSLNIAGPQHPLLATTLLKDSIFAHFTSGFSLNLILFGYTMGVAGFYNPPGSTITYKAAAITWGNLAGVDLSISMAAVGFKVYQGSFREQIEAMRGSAVKLLQPTPQIVGEFIVDHWNHW